MDDKAAMLEAAKAVLAMNDQGTHTIPAEGLYPHQWLWDSCFIAIGLSHYDIERAQTEILSLLSGQWENGMLPHVILSSGPQHHAARTMWRSWISPYSPDNVVTSGITQPPMLAEAIIRIGEQLSLPERRLWYRKVYSPLVRYHLWLYNERDPHDEGLVLLVHPWETGLDNTPPWMSELHQHQLPWWIRFIKRTHLDILISFFRRDRHFASTKQRLSTVEALALYSIQRRLRRKAYNIDRILTHSLFAVEDVTFNSILIRANHCLEAIARSLREELPAELSAHIKKSEGALEQLWDPYAGQYFSRNFVTHNLLKEPSIGTLMPLYAGSITAERAGQLVKMIENKHLFGPAYPIPSTPLNSNWFKPFGYWQGPTWVNTNWLIVDGLRRYGFHEHADALTELTLEMIQQAGFYEYFNPLDGRPAGTNNFSWTASLTIDFLKNLKPPTKKKAKAH